ELFARRELAGVVDPDDVSGLGGGVFRFFGDGDREARGSSDLFAGGGLGGWFCGDVGGWFVFGEQEGAGEEEDCEASTKLRECHRWVLSFGGDLDDMAQWTRPASGPGKREQLSFGDYFETDAVSALRTSVRSCSTLKGLKRTACRPSWLARTMLWLGS